MADVTYILSYYENPRMLAEQYRRIRTIPKALRPHLRIIVVDDGSPNNPAVPGDTREVPLQIYRMGVDIRWNQDACRNIGVHYATTEFVFLTDMDHAPSKGLWRHLLGRKWNGKAAHQFQRVSAPEMKPFKHHPNTWLMTRTMYDRAGGYDERFAGWYGTDRDFQRRLETVAVMSMYGGPPIIRYPREFIPDASTTQFERKTQADRDNIHAIKTAREQDPEWKPLRLQFPHSLVYDSEAQTNGTSA